METKKTKKQKRKITKEDIYKLLQSITKRFKNDK